MNELFNISDVTHESPRLAWIKRHGVKTHHSTHFDIDGEQPWCAWDRSNWTGKDGDGIPNEPGRCGFGETEHDAIADLADLLGVPLWNEEEFAATTAQKRQNEKP